MLHHWQALAVPCIHHVHHGVRVYAFSKVLPPPLTQRAAMLALLDYCGVKIAQANAVVVGRGRVVGLPAALMLMHRNATVSVAHRQTPARDLEHLIRTADIVVAAAGVPELVRGEWIKPGAVVLDVGLTRRTDGTLLGDVDFNEAAKVRYTTNA